jgi:tRNA dimethylallyltransferase
MSSENSIAPLVAIVGPTASGKSALGVFLAQKLRGEVVACDSTQLYRGFDVGTAKPSLAERQGILHHLIDVLDASQHATAGGYRDMALQVLGDLRRRNRLPIFTVGTGLYLRALLEGLADIPQRCEEVRARLRKSAELHQPGHLHRMLQRLDPESAARIAAADEQKLIRAVEVCLLSKKPISELHRAGRAPLVGWKPLQLALLPPREALYERIHARTDAMLQAGWAQEVQALVESGVSEDTKPFDFIGYRELRNVLRGSVPLAEARVAIQQSTRRYAKRQLSWFRNSPGGKHFEGFGDDAQIQNQALEWVSQKLAAMHDAGASGV